MRLGGEALTLGYEQETVARGLSLSIPDGQISVFIGRNGCGKSTILKALARLLKPHSGQVILDGHAIQTLPSREVARRLAILPQSPRAPEGLTVEDLVWYGRHPHRGFFGTQSPADRKAVEWALEVTGVQDLRNKQVDSLSGGQRQRAWIALALAQETNLLLLDEPTTYLDLAYQIELLELLKRLNQETGKTIAMVLHDLNLAAQYAHRLFVVHGGGIMAQGSPRQVLTSDLLQQVFGLRAHIMDHPVTGNPQCIPL